MIADKLKTVESSGNPRALRYEPGFRRLYVDKLDLPEEEAVFRSTSWGLWQIMGQVLRELGYTGGSDEFCSRVDIQEHYARKLWARNLAALRKRIPRVQLWQVVEAWNKGVAGAARLSGPTEYFRKFERA